MSVRLVRLVVDAPPAAPTGTTSGVRLVRLLTDAPGARAAPATSGVRLVRLLADAPSATPSLDWVDLIRVGGVLTRHDELQRINGRLL